MGLKFDTPAALSALSARITNDQQRLKTMIGVREYLRNQLSGRFYDAGDRPAFEQGDAGNPTLEMIANVVPDIAFQRPKATVSTSKQGPADEVARGTSESLNRWMHESKYEQFVERTAYDFVLQYTCFQRGVGPKPSTQMDKNDTPQWPWNDRLNPGLFGFDTDADSWEEREYAYNIIIEYKDDLLDRARHESDWDVKQVELMEPGLGRDMKPGRSRDYENKVAYYYIHLVDADATPYLPKGADPKLYHGVILTLSARSSQQGGMVQIRKPMAYFGPQEGPFGLIGMHWIPDEAVPTSVTVLTLGQQIEYTDILRANNQSARDWKRIFLVDDQRLARLIERGAHHRCYYHAGLNSDQMQAVELGGLTDQQIAQETRVRENFDRARGLTDAERGAVRGEATATEAGIASAASTKRRAGQSNTFHRGHEENLGVIAWFLYNTDGVVVNLAGAEGMGEGAVFFGGNVKPIDVLRYYQRENPDAIQDLDLSQVTGRKIPWEDLEVRVELGSMGRKTQAERMVEGQQKLEFLGAFQSTLVNNPGIPVDRAKRIFAELTGWSELTDLTDEELIGLTRAALFEGEVPPAQADVAPGTMLSGTGQGGLIVEPNRPQALLPQNASTQGPGSSTPEQRSANKAVSVN